MDIPPPPEGATLIQESLPSAPPPPPMGAMPMDIPPPPPGAIPLDMPPPPPGAVLHADTIPQPPPPQEPNTEVPGFWHSAGIAYGRGVAQNAADAAAGSKVFLPKGAGGTTLEEQYQDGLLHPDTQDEITKLQNQKIFEGWTDPKWWGVNLAHAVGGMTPGLGAGLVGAGFAGPIGAIGGFASESAMSSLVPAYKKARAEGLDVDAATQRALIDSGIALAGAVAMGLAPGLSIFGRKGAQDLSSEMTPAMIEAAQAAAEAFKRPVMEALAQLGLVQPLIGDAQHIVTELSHGELPGWEDLLTTHAIGTGAGVVPVGVHAAARAIRIRPVADSPPASDATLNEAHENQKTSPNLVYPADMPPPPAGATRLPWDGEGQDPLQTPSKPWGEHVDPMQAPAPPWGAEQLDPLQSPRESTVVPREGELSSEDTVLHPSGQANPVYYSLVKRVITEKVPDNATPQDVLGILRNHPGVKPEELEYYNLPGYLADIKGRVNKADLLIHMEANDLILEEVVRGAELPEPPEVKAAYAYNEAMIRKYGSIDFERMTPEEMAEFDRVHIAASGKYPPEVEQPKYINQNLPGPYDYYREFVLKTRPKPITPEELDARAKRIYDNQTEAFVKQGLYRREEIPPWEHLNDREVFHEHATRNIEWERTYESSHWPDKNPIVHFRVTYRSSRDGHLLLHVEEIQSDLHQGAREVGYRNPKVRPYADVSKEFSALNVEGDALALEHPYMWTADGMLEAEREGRVSPKVTEYLARRKTLYEEYKAAQDNKKAMPDLPFKGDSWKELAVKRILRLAAEEGVDGVSWSNGDQVGLRLGNADELAGVRKFYDEQLPKIFKKWVKKVGGTIRDTMLEGVDTTDINPFQRDRLRKMGLDVNKMDKVNLFVEVNPAMGEIIKMGFPLFEQGPSGKHTLSEAFIKGMPRALVGPGKKIAAALGKLGDDLHLSLPLKIDIRPRPSKWRGKAYRRNGQYEIHANTRLIRTPEDLYATLGHELGHVIHWDKYGNAPLAVRLQIEEAFRKYRVQMTQEARTVGDVRRVRDNAVSEMTGGRNPQHAGGIFQNDLNLSDLTSNSRIYLLHFKEWFAEQGAKWATTSEKPLSRVDKFFSDLGKTVRALLERFQVLRGRPATAEKVMQEWMDSLVHEDTSILAQIKDQTALEGLRVNQDAIERDGTPGVQATPQTASTVGGRNIIDSLPPSARSSGAASAAHGDRMNKFYELMTSLPQIASMNKHIRGLQIYKVVVGMMNKEKNEWMVMAEETRRAWAAIRDPKQQIGLTRFIDDYARGLFKDPSDMSGSVRRPTKKEFFDLARKHGLSDQSVKLFDRVRNDFDVFLEHYRELLLADAGRIKEPEARMVAEDSIHRQVDSLLQRPFFPITRFGKYTITVYDSAGNIKHSEHTNSLRKQRQIVAALEKSVDLLPGDWVRPGEVPKDAAPLLGMPPGLLDLMEEKLNMSDTMRDALDQMRFDYAPSQSFRHQFKTRDVTPGYSTDFQRSYAHFFFHGANHITRVKWVDALRDQIREVKTESLKQENKHNARKHDAIANYMTTHLDMLTDPKPDFAALRGLMFHWYLGFNPASAVTNLTQTAVMTFPHLASKFGGLGVGDAKAIWALAKASLELNNYYKKGTLLERGGATDASPKAKALAEAVREGVISETQAHTLAAVSEGRNLLNTFGTKAETGWRKFSEASSYLFEMTEQYNRRVAFRASWELAMKDPNNKYVSETVRDNPLLYQRLKSENWNHQEASAFIAAKHSVETSQFVYAPYARPKFMWGRKGALFIFKSFTQNTLFNLANNPAAGVRSLLILGYMGGLMGLPGMEDIGGLIKALAFRVLGKDFDVEAEARKFAVDVLDGTISPDVLLHGASTKGFGIPHVMNMLGAHVGLPRFFPTPDMHGNVGMGNILPFEPGKFFVPGKDPAKNELAQLQRASGAAFSLGFALYSFLQGDMADRKNWEKVMPRVMSNISHAFRYGQEGMERNKSGNSVVRFDVNDTEHMAEIIMRAAGFQPRRLTGAYEAIQAKSEAQAYWETRQGLLLHQFAAAVKGGNAEEKAKVIQSIRNYNSLLPPELKAAAITSELIRQSVATKMKNAVKQEAGMPTSKKYIKMFQEMDKYYPDGRPTGMTGVKKVQ